MLSNTKGSGETVPISRHISESDAQVLGLTRYGRQDIEMPATIKEWNSVGKPGCD
jgi:hypothetical protein